MSNVGELSCSKEDGIEEVFVWNNALFVVLFDVTIMCGRRMLRVERKEWYGRG